MSTLPTQPIQSTSASQPLPAFDHALLSDDQRYAALISRDARFDGQFYTGVKTTGIYCRSVCPAVKPKRKNVSFYPSAASAELAGFRPCLRCRPALAPQLEIQEPILAAAITLIENGFLQHNSVADLAHKMGYSERHFRQLFQQRLACTPSQFQQQQRMAIALQLLSNSDLSITDIANAAGFNSLRRLNDSFTKQYQRAPSSFRRSSISKNTFKAALSFQFIVPVSPDYNWPQMLNFHADRAMSGIEAVNDNCWHRLVNISGKIGMIKVGYSTKNKALFVDCDRSLLSELPTLLKHIDTLFDCKAPLAQIQLLFEQDGILANSAKTNPGIALAGTWSVWECLVRAIIGQLISIAAAATIHQRLVLATSLRVEGYGDFQFLFPTPEAILAHPLEGLGLSKQKISTLKLAAQHYLDGSFGEERGVSLEERLKLLCAVKGIGMWTAQYVAMRGYKYPNAFPAGDLVLQKVAGNTQDTGENHGQRLSEKQLLNLAAPWQPWRAYAAMHLWQMYNASLANAKPCTTTTTSKS